MSRKDRRKAGLSHLGRRTLALEGFNDLISVTGIVDGSASAWSAVGAEWRTGTATTARGDPG